jgi:4-amino-4-deoxy-L-arabinose transferase-like glycosyltransferase
LELSFILTASVATLLLIDRLAFELELAPPHITSSATVVAAFALALGVAAIAALAGCLYALYPYPAVLCGILQQDILVTFAVALAVFATIRASSRDSRAAAWLVAGVCVGLAALVKNNFVALVLVPVVAAIARHAPRRTRYVAGCAVLIGFALTIAPWMVRNYLVFGNVPPLAVAGTGENITFILEELDPHRVPTVMVHGKRYPFEIAGYQIDGPDLIAAQRELIVRSMPELARVWPQYMVLVVKRVPWLWLTRGTFGRSSAVGGIAVALSVALFVLAVFGVVKTWPDRNMFLVLYLTIGVITLMYAPIRVEGRYSLPARPAQMIFVAVAVRALLDRYVVGRTRTR